MGVLDDLLANVNGGWSNPVVNSITIPTGAGVGTPRVVIGAPPDCLNPITNGFPTSYNGRTAVFCIQMYNTGSDFMFIAEVIASSGNQRNIVTTGRAANSVAGSEVDIIGGNFYDLGLAVPYTSFYNALAINDGIGGTGFGSAQLQITRSSAAGGLGAPLQIFFRDGNNTGHFTQSPVLGLAYLNGSGSSQAASGTITWAQIFGVPGLATNAINDYPVFSGTPLLIEGEIMFNGTSTGSGIVAQIHRMVGASPVPATDPVIATVRGTVGVANANDTRAFRQVYFNQAQSGRIVETYYMSIFAFGAGTVTLVSQSDGSLFGLTWFSVKDCGSFS